MRLAEPASWRRRRERWAATYKAARSTYLAFQDLARERDSGSKPAEPKMVLGPGYIG
jgi:hypothetical protein